MKVATDKLSITLRAIADPTRRKIIRLLGSTGAAANGLTATDLQKKIKMAQPTVSHHMKVLVGAGLVEMEKKGTWVWYTADKKAIGALSKALSSEL